MDLKTLMAQHPDVYEAAVQAGVDQERERVAGHLKMAELSGDNKTAFEAIREGTGMTAELTASYTMAAVNKKTIEARGADNPDGDLGAAPTAEDGELAGKNIMAIAAEKCGVELEV